MRGAIPSADTTSQFSVRKGDDLIGFMYDLFVGSRKSFYQILDGDCIRYAPRSELNVWKNTDRSSD